jgi:hypothetical protein
MVLEFGVIRRRFGLELDELALLQAAAEASPPLELNAVSEYCIVQLLDCWNRFVRDIVLASATGRARDVNGKAILPGPQGALSRAAAMQYVRIKWPKGKKPYHWEPSWFDVGQADMVLDVLQPANALTLKTALGANTNPTEQLRAVRNYCAHRGPISAAKLRHPTRNWGPAQWRRPHDLVFHRPLQQMDSIYEGWTGGFRLVASAMVR